MHFAIAKQLSLSLILSLPLILSLSLYSLPARSSTISPYFKLDSFTYSETVSIRDTLNDWEGDTFNRGKRQWTWNWAEAGIRYDHWGIGFLYRVDYDLRFSKDLSEIYWKTKNKVDLPVGETFNAKLSANAFRSRGYRFTYHNTLAGNFSYTAGISYLSAYYMIEGDVQGNASVLTEKDYDFNLDLNYQYTKDTLFDREVEKPKGEGYALDISIAYQITAQDHLQLQVSDLYGVITWKDAPVTTGTATSDRKRFDEDGYAIIDPLISGHEGILKSFEQRLEPRWFLSYQHTFDKSVGVRFKARQQYGHALYAIGSSYTKHGNWAIDYWVDNQLIELSWSHRAIKTSIGIDSLQKDEAKQFWLSFAFEIGR